MYGAIIKGFRAPLTRDHKTLLMNVLLPLHMPHERIDEQTPAIGRMLWLYIVYPPCLDTHVRMMTWCDV